MNVDGSSTPQVFKLKPRSGEYAIELHKAVVYVEDAGTFDSGSFGNGISLTNGISLAIYDSNDNVVLDLMAGKNITTNPHWGSLCERLELSSYGAGNESLTAHFDFNTTMPCLYIGPNQYLGITIADDLTGLVDFHFFGIGCIILE